MIAADIAGQKAVRRVARNNTLTGVPSLIGLWFAQPLFEKTGLAVANYVIMGVIIGWCLALWAVAFTVWAFSPGLKAPVFNYLNPLHRSNRDVNEANARLICVAPELLESCKTLLHIIHSQVACVDSKFHVGIEKVQALIAKAEGKES